MFRFATTQKKHPVAIRGLGNFVSSGIADTTDYSIPNKNKVERKGSGAVIFAVGCLLPMALATADIVKAQTGKEITVINPRFLTGLDTELLENLKADHSLVLTIEDCEKQGGYGQTIASYYGDSSMKVLNYGISKAFHTDYKPEELLAENGMSAEQLAKTIYENL